MFRICVLLNSLRPRALLKHRVPLNFRKYKAASCFQTKIPGTLRYYSQLKEENVSLSR